jgi:hypothetical protein
VRWDAAIEQGRAERQVKRASIPFEQERDRISSFLMSLADHYGIDLPLSLS